MLFRKSVLGSMIALTLAGMVPSMAQSTPLTNFEKATVKAEEAFQAGDTEVGLNLLLPYIEHFSGNAEATRAIFDRHPAAAAAFAKRVERAVQTASTKNDTLNAALLLTRAGESALIAPDLHAKLKAVLSARAIDQNRRGTVAWLLTDRYKTVPGLTEPEQERAIFKRSLNAATRQPSKAATVSLLHYVQDHPDDTDAHARVRAVLPRLPMSDGAGPLIAALLFPGVPVRVEPEPMSPQARREREADQRAEEERQHRRWQEEMARERERQRDEEWKRDRERVAEERQREEHRRWMEEQERAAESRRAEDERKHKEDQRRREEELRRIEDQRKADEQKRTEERRKFEEQRKADEQKRAEEQRKFEEQRKADEQKRAEERRKFEEQRKADEQKRAEEQRKFEEQRKADEQRRAEERRKFEEQRKAEEQRRAEEERRYAEERRRAEEERRRASR